MTEFAPFHSAANRVPVLRAAAQDAVDAGGLPAGLFSDSPAAGHDHLDPHRWSGSMDLVMTLRTPLVFGEQSQVQDGAESGPVVEVPRDASNRLVVPPTMVKGMVSRAFETLTCSRFRVFGDTGNHTGRRRTQNDHSTRLTYRGDPASALRLIPVRLVSGSEEEGFTAELLEGVTSDRRDYVKDGIVYPTMMAACLQGGESGHARLVLDGGVARLNELAPHGAAIRCHMTLCLHGDGPRRGRGPKPRYSYWQVTHIRNGDGEFVEVFRIRDAITTIEHMDDVIGYVCRTAAEGDSPQRLFARKHDERVFFDTRPSGPRRAAVPAEACQAYRIVLDSYVANRRAEVAFKVSAKERRRPNRATAEAQHGRAAQAAEARGAAEAPACPVLHVGDLLYAHVDETEDGPVVRELLPVMISRRAFSLSPRDLGAAQNVLPVAGRNEASAADRVFGYVVPQAAPGAAGGDVAARGHVSFGVVDTSGARVETRPKQLLPLLAPKPSSARRFLTDSQGRTPRAEPEPRRDRAGASSMRKPRLTRNGAPLPLGGFFARGQLLGAAAYPVHRDLLDAPGFPASATRLPPGQGRKVERKVEDEKNGNDKVRIVAKSWVATGSVLRCTMSFTNLSAEEFGALMWVLTPENLVPASERAKDPTAVGFLRMGLGKPLGLGILEVRVDPSSLRVESDGTLARRYEALDGCFGSAREEDAQDVPALDERVVAELVRQPWVRAMQRAAFGYADRTEVRHMTLEENKVNNQTDFSDGRPKPGAGQAPGDLCAEQNLHPIHLHKKAMPRKPGQGNRSGGYGPSRRPNRSPRS